MKPRVLVVDDDPQVLKLFVTILEKGGYAVLSTDSGGDVMQLLRREALDLVVLDLNMPPPDGFELLKQLRSSMPGLRILVTSGYLGGALLKAAELLGATATLPKADAPGNLIDLARYLVR
jgi:CheY-like chemotaxis protein